MVASRGCVILASAAFQGKLGPGWVPPEFLLRFRGVEVVNGARI
jgi:hypothetical protein